MEQQLISTNSLPITVSDLVMTFETGRFNIINCGCRTGKTYWAVNNLKQFTRDGQLNRILFLTDTRVLRDEMREQYAENCCEANDWWWDRASWGERPANKIGVACYQSLVSRILKKTKSKFNFFEEIDCICWDECDSIFDFAASEFVKARKSKFAREDATDKEILGIIQAYSTDRDFSSLVFLAEWEKIINDGRIVCIGLSATPERTQDYFSSLCHSANEGKLRAAYKLEKEVYFTDLKKHLATLKPQEGKGLWIYSPRVGPNLELAEYLKEQGHTPIALYSRNNPNYKMSEEQIQVENWLIATGKVLDPYDCVIANRAFQRGINLRDERFEDVIVDAFDKTAREQAARNTFPYRLHMKVHSTKVPDEYKNKWLTLSECRELAECMAVIDERTTSYRKMTWNKLKEFLPRVGYAVESKRKRMNGKQQLCYYISGEFQDYDEEDKDFMQLVKTKQEECQDE